MNDKIKNKIDKLHDNHMAACSARIEASDTFYDTKTLVMLLGMCILLLPRFIRKRLREGAGS